MKNFIFLFCVVAVKIQGPPACAAEPPAWTKSLAHYSEKLPPEARGAFIATTKGGVRYVIYSPLDEFGSNMADQRRLWWVTEAWDDDDKPYAAARRGIDMALRSGANPLTLVTKYQEELKSDPWNPRKVFPWAYASWLARKRVKTRDESNRIFNPVGERMAEVRFIGSYQYARMAFLAQAQTWPRFALKRVGEKLLQRDPSDQEVKLAMIRVLTAGKNTGKGSKKIYDPRDDQLALSYANDFRRRYPQEIKYDYLYADTLQYLYIRQYPLERQKGDAAIAAFQRVLRKNPDNLYRMAAMAHIADIKRQQKDWQMWGLRNWEKEQLRLRTLPAKSASRSNRIKS
jgi:hypothetical protein